MTSLRDENMAAQAAVNRMLFNVKKRKQATAHDHQAEVLMNVQSELLAEEDLPREVIRYSLLLPL